MLSKTNANRLFWKYYRTLIWYLLSLRTIVGWLVWRSRAMSLVEWHCFAALVRICFSVMASWSCREPCLGMVSAVSEHSMMNSGKSSTSILFPPAVSTKRSTMFCSSRMLPGHWNPASTFSAADVIIFSWWYFSLYTFKNSYISTGISSTRSCWDRKSVV